MMKKAQRLLLQRLLTLASFLVAGVGTAIWWRYKSAGTPAPMWVLGVIGYGWAFVALLAFNMIGRTYSRKRRG
ncbi:hypothetical protein [Tumebacillus permanentifrigoris]|uniref:Uncharacterized protein n=1 Tax=Tumebacillus permanentifrigoris TaxID=378543 RepID=A0A316D6X4_9BACL|nr:hypothetical protein [Tumebacillus permanentifrigoris]PWK10344.1 hypothetical protein C7459_112166 [Tumebacillus permanentifrigoris]